MIKYCLTLIYFLLSTIVYSQESIITGLILDENNLPIQSVNISLGKNILRAETATISIISIISYILNL